MPLNELVKDCITYGLEEKEALALQHACIIMSSGGSSDGGHYGTG